MTKIGIECVHRRRSGIANRSIVACGQRPDPGPTLLSNAEIAKDDVQQVLDLDAARHAAERANRLAQLLGGQHQRRGVAVAQVSGARAQAIDALLQVRAVPLARDERVLRAAAAGETGRAREGGTRERNRERCKHGILNGGHEENCKQSK